MEGILKNIPTQLSIQFQRLIMRVKLTLFQSKTVTYVNKIVL